MPVWRVQGLFGAFQLWYVAVVMLVGIYLRLYRVSRLRKQAAHDKVTHWLGPHFLLLCGGFSYK